MLYARRNGFSMSQLRALVHISQGTRGVRDIGDDLEVSSAAASQMLERLVQQGLITREEDPHDRRVKQIVLTEKGRQVVVDGLRAGRAWVDTLAASLSPDEIDLVASALAIMASLGGTRFDTIRNHHTALLFTDDSEGKLRQCFDFYDISSPMCS
jgi:DNA-binding MarR family transcriptional regulator